MVANDLAEMVANDLAEMAAADIAMSRTHVAMVSNDVAMAAADTAMSRTHRADIAFKQCAYVVESSRSSSATRVSRLRPRGLSGRATDPRIVALDDAAPSSAELRETPCPSM